MTRLLPVAFLLLLAAAAPAPPNQLWVGGQNLFVTGNYRGFDPNVSGGGASPLLAGQDGGVYPVVRVWQVGVRGQF